MNMRPSDFRTATYLATRSSQLRAAQSGHLALKLGNAPLGLGKLSFKRLFHTARIP